MADTIAGSAVCRLGKCFIKLIYLQLILRVTELTIKEWAKVYRSDSSNKNKHSTDIKPLTGESEDWSGANEVRLLEEQMEYSKETLKMHQRGRPDFDSLFEGDQS